MIFFYLFEYVKKFLVSASPVTLEDGGKQPDRKVAEGRGQPGVCYATPNAGKPVQR